MKDTISQPASADCNVLLVGRQNFSVGAWNSLFTEFRDLSVGLDVFRSTLKTILFARY